MSDKSRSLTIHFSHRPGDVIEDDGIEDEDIIVLDEDITDDYYDGLRVSDELLDEYSDSPMLMLREGGPPSFDGRGFQMFPAIGAKVFSTNGAIANEGRREISDLTAIVVFSGGDSASAPLPITNLQSVKPITDVYSEDGKKVSVRPVRNAGNYGLKTEQPIYGAFLIQYRTTYKQYYWKFDGPKDATEEFYLQGVVVAYFEGSSATLEFDWGSSGISLDKTEIYRVVSKYVVDSAGGWEYPPGWPDDTSYSQSSTDDQPDNSAAQVLERVHYIGYVNKRGSESTDFFLVHIEEPFRGHSSYRPQYHLETTRSAPDGFESAFESIDFAQIESDMRDRFPNIET